MSLRLPDHTPASLGDVRAVSLASLLAQAEVPCKDCNGFTWDDESELDCSTCHGVGRELTADGMALLAFLGRHGVVRATRRRVIENGPHILPCSDTPGDGS